MENIDKVQSANSFKISDKLDVKDDGNGYNVKLFLESLAGAFLAKYYILMMNIQKKDILYVLNT